MANNLFTRLGWALKKPVEEEQPEVEDKEGDFRRSVNDQLSFKTAEMYKTAMPKEFLEELMGKYNYKTLFFGARKVARLCDICRSILDIEINEGMSEFNDSEPLIKKEDQNDVLRLLFYMCWLIPIVIREYTLSNKAKEKLEPLFKKWLAEDYSLVKAVELDLVLDGVFEGINCSDNVVLNIFHDALRIEDSYGNSRIDLSSMRTTLGKNQVFAKHSRLRADKNITPTWIVYFSDLMGTEKLIDVNKKEEDDAYASDDGIS